MAKPTDLDDYRMRWEIRALIRRAAEGRKRIAELMRQIKADTETGNKE